VFEVFGEVNGGIAKHRRLLNCSNNFATRKVIVPKFFKPKRSREVKGVVI
jgi:hypothetical protein